MKTYLLAFMVFLTGFGQLMAQNVPDVVIQGFQEKYPNTDAHWEDEDETFEAEFKMDGREATALFNSEGKWLKTEKLILAKELPKDVLTKVKKNYRNHEIEGVEWVVSASEGEYYRLELENGTKALELKVFLSGKMTVSALDDEEDDD